MNPGDSAPDFPVLLGSGKTARLSDYRGRWLVLYCYPKDNTPGCTTEGLDFTTLHPEFQKLGAEILGMSRDSVKSHANFSAKQSFTFDLIADTDQALCHALGVIKEKNMYGRKVLGIERSTFLFDPQGRLYSQWRGVKVTGHAAAVLAELSKLSDPSSRD